MNKGIKRHKKILRRKVRKNKKKMQNENRWKDKKRQWIIDFDEKQKELIDISTTLVDLRNKGEESTDFYKNLKNEYLKKKFAYWSVNPRFVENFLDNYADMRRR